MNQPEHAWRVSSYSTNGNNCVEVAVWRKSARSTNGTNCVEVGTTSDVAYVRDTKDRSVGPLAFGGADWRALLAGVKAGRFDLP